MLFYGGDERRAQLRVWSRVSVGRALLLVRRGVYQKVVVLPDRLYKVFFFFSPLESSEKKKKQSVCWPRSLRSPEEV